MENFPKVGFKCGGVVYDCLLVRNQPGFSVLPEYWSAQPEIHLVADDTENNRNHDVNFGELITACTKLLPHPAEEGCCFIKSYSENEGLLETLVEAGYVEVTGNYQQSGFVSFPECRVINPDNIPEYSEISLQSEALA